MGNRRDDLKEDLIAAMDRYNAALQAWNETVKNGRLDPSTREEAREAEEAYAAAAQAWDEACEKIRRGRSGGRIAVTKRMRIIFGGPGE